MTDKFSMYKKWFWVGIFIGFLNSAAGLVYGIALMRETGHKKEGWVIVGWSALMLVFTYALTRLLIAKGLFTPPVYAPIAGSQ